MYIFVVLKRLTHIFSLIVQFEYLLYDCSVIGVESAYHSDQLKSTPVFGGVCVARR